MTRDSLSLGPVVSPAVQLLFGFGPSFSSATYSAPQYCTWVGGSQRRAYIISVLASTSRPRALSNGRRRGTVWLSLDLVGRSVVSVARWSIEVSQPVAIQRRGEARRSTAYSKGRRQVSRHVAMPPRYIFRFPLQPCQCPAAPGYTAGRSARLTVCQSVRRPITACASCSVRLTD